MIWLRFIVTSVEVFRQLNYLPLRIRVLVLKEINRKVSRKVHMHPNNNNKNKTYIHIFIKTLKIFSGQIGKWVIFNRKYLKINVCFFLWKIWMLWILKRFLMVNSLKIIAQFQFCIISQRETLIKKTVSHNNQCNGVSMSYNESNVQKLIYLSWFSLCTSVEGMLF